MNRIKKARMLAGLSQKYVAMTLGVAGPSVSNWESGKTKPTPENYAALARLFDVSVGYLMGVEEETTILNYESEQPIQETAHADPITTEGLELLSQLNEDQLDSAIEYMRFLLSQKKK